MASFTEEIIGSLKLTLENKEFQNRHKLKKNNFTRNRKLNFVTVAVILINNVSKSINVELNKFLLFFKNTFASKQAFSKARYNLKPSAFVELNRNLISLFYKKGSVELYKDKYIVLSSDGTNFRLPHNSDLIEEFGYMDNTQGKHPSCFVKCIKIWDCLNNLSIDSSLYGYNKGELMMFKDSWNRVSKMFSELGNPSRILLGDMAYPAFWMFHMLNEADVFFLFRCKKNFCTEAKIFMESGESVGNIRIDMTLYRRKENLIRQGFSENLPDFINVRMHRMKKKDSNPTFFISSVNENFSHKEIQELYELRWGEEVSFHFDKNKTEIENFSTKKPLGIRQEWQASILSSNIAQLLINDAQIKLDKEQKKKNNKYHYKINKSVALGLVKDEFPKLILGIEKHDVFYNRMINLIIKFKEPERKNRLFPRIRKYSNKYSMNLRRIS